MMGRKTSHKPRGGDICTIVVHAGAGYHSIANQDVHLRACSDACAAAMSILRSGGTATDAVEMAIKILEDREITNAGYGSNLAIDGVVECDALMIDHMGRSGGVGACPQIKNPISLARLVYQRSLEQLTLRRVPPNLLVSQGAVDFAYEAGVPVLPYDALVSPGARERWVRWTRDLERAEWKKRERVSSSPPPYATMFARQPVDPVARDSRDNAAREAHRNTLLNYANKRRKVSESSTPLLPPSSPRGLQRVETPQTSITDDNSSEIDDTEEEYIDVVGPPPALHEASTNALINSSQNIPTLLTLEGDRVVETWAPSIEGSSDERKDEDMIDNPILPPKEEGPADEETDDESDNSASTDSTLQLPSLTPSPQTGPITQGDGYTSSADPTMIAMRLPIPPTPLEKPESPSPTASTPLQRVTELPPLPPSPKLLPTKLDSNLPAPVDEDRITDTVGAIAIDSFGNIASGASSGGIGMKHRGRVGPAALVGVGAAVVPVHPNDKSKTCVSAVTSGTGEHMGTTLAASVCADRLYSCLQKSDGGPLESVGEEKVLRGFIEREFMMHSSVKNSNSAGAIGIVSLKKTRDGVHLYFAHNTDSFALASMCSEDQEPLTAMSRTKGNATIAEGARAMRMRRKKA